MIDIVLNGNNGNGGAAMEGDPRLAKAEAEFAKEDIIAATGLCKEILEENPQHEGALFLFARVLLFMGQVDEGLQYLLLVLQHNNENAAAHKIMAGYALRQGKADNAVNHLETTAKLDPSDAEAQHWLAQAYAEVGKQDAAIAALSRSIEADASYVPVHITMALVGLIEQNSEAFDAHLSNAETIDASHPLVAFAKAKKALQAGDEQGALAICDAGFETAKIASDHAYLLLLRGQILDKIGEKDEAQLALEEAQKMLQRECFISKIYLG